jgi:hypothetical protein
MTKQEWNDLKKGDIFYYYNSFAMRSNLYIREKRTSDSYYSINCDKEIFPTRDTLALSTTNPIEAFVMAIRREYADF